MSKQVAILWDMDGTLVDTGELHFEAWGRVCQEENRPFTREDFRATFGKRNQEIIEYLFHGKMSEEETEQFGNLKEEYYRAETRKQGVTLLPGVGNLLSGLKELGALQGIGSSAPKKNLELILELTGIQPFLSTLVAMEDTQRGKPDPQVFQLGAQRLGVQPGHCVVMEDAVAGVQAARAGGMKCVAVRFIGHHDEEKLLQAGANRVVHTLEEVTPMEVFRLAHS
ncbi:MAG: HAD family phosphatase [Gemmataceae bacterium]|nr:HAD family phosphatase [Gemmataceae bacterium]